MIQDHQVFDLLGRKTFEKAVVKSPLRMLGSFPDEACFYYVVKGTTKTYTEEEQIITNQENGVLLHCGNYLNEFLDSGDYEFCEAVAVHLYPEILKEIYNQDFPDFLVNVEKIKPIKYQTVQASELLKVWRKSDNGMS